MSCRAADSLPCLGLSAVALASLGVVWSMPAPRGPLVFAVVVAALAAASMSLGGCLTYRSATFGCVAFAFFAALSRPVSLVPPVFGPASLLALVCIATTVCRLQAQLEAAEVPAKGRWATVMEPAVAERTHARAHRRIG